MEASSSTSSSLRRRAPFRCYYAAKTSVSRFVDSRQPWQKVLWLSKLLGISIWVFCFTGVQFFCLKSSLVVEVYFSIFLCYVSLLSAWFAFQVGRKCKFSQWRDDEICERDKVLIPEQRQQIIKQEAEVARCYKREKFYIVTLAFLLVICGICLFNCMRS